MLKAAAVKILTNHLIGPDDREGHQNNYQHELAAGDLIIKQQQQQQLEAELRGRETVATASARPGVSSST